MTYRGNGGKSKAEVLEILRDKMLFMDLKPGSAIQDNELAAELNVSRTPVREALLILQKEGLVDIYPQSGTFVSLIDLPLLCEISYIRTTLERDVFQTLVARKADIRQRLERFVLLQELAFREKNVKDYVINDHHFHETLFEEAGHPYAWKIIEPRFRLVTRFQMLYFRSSDSFWENSLGEHKQIIDCIESGDEKQLKHLLSVHYSCISMDSEMLKRYPDYFLQTD